MRYYVMTVQHNQVADAENRSVPKAFNSLLEAKQSFHSQLGTDINNNTLDWSVVFILSEYGEVISSERWDRPVVKVTTDEETVSTPAISGGLL